MAERELGRRRTSQQKAEHEHRVDEGFLKFEYPDWDTECLFQEHAGEAILPAESHSNQEDTISVPGDSFGQNKKRLREDLKSSSRHSLDLVVSNTALPQKRQNSGKKQTDSPRDRSSDSGDDSRELRGSGRQLQRKNYAEQLEKPDPVAAAKNKASRERLRRERLNESFVELTRTLDPEKYVRAEKTTIIAETIKLITGLRQEVQQLREDKDLLKGKVEESEKHKETLVFQQSLLKLELETAQAANYNHQQQARGGHFSPGLQAPMVAMGVPLQDVNRTNTSGISQFLQASAEQQRPSSAQQLPTDHMWQPPPLQQANPQASRNADVPLDIHASVTDAFLVSSPPDFLDIDMGLQRDLAGLDVHPVTTGVSPISWLE